MIMAVVLSLEFVHQGNTKGDLTGRAADRSPISKFDKANIHHRGWPFALI